MSNVPTTTTTSSQNQPPEQPTSTSPPSASPAIVQETKLNYAQAVGKTTSGTSTPPQAAASSSGTPTTSTPQTTPSQHVSMNVSYPNGTAKPVMPPTGPAANGPRNHSRVSSAVSSYRPQPPPPQGPHNSKPSVSGQPPFGYIAQSPRIPNNGRNSPFPDFHDGQSPPQSRNGPISMARHGSQSSQSERQIPPSPRTNNRGPVSGPYPYQQYPSQPTFTPGGGYNQGIPGRGGNFRNSTGSAPTFQHGMQYQRSQPPRSPNQQSIPLVSQHMPPTPQSMYNLQHMQHMPPAGTYGNSHFPQYASQYVDVNRGDMQYIQTTPDQYSQQMSVQGPYMYQPSFHQQAPQQPQHSFPNAPQQQLFSPQVPPPPAQFTPSRPINQPMSRSTSVASEVNHQSQKSTATPSPAPKEDTPVFTKPKKSAAIKIVNPDTKTEIILPKPAVAAATKIPDRSPSPAVKPPVKSIPRVAHSPVPSIDAVERPSSGQKSKEEIAEEMKIKIQKSFEETKKKKAEKEEAERLEREKKLEEERKAKEEAERLEKERKEEEERKLREERRLREEQERIDREKEEAERKAEEERIAAQKAKEEEEARIAKEKAEAEAALEAARLAKEQEEAKAREEAKAKEEAKRKEEAEALAAEDKIVGERQPSFGRKNVPSPIAIKEEAVPEKLQSAALKNASFIKQDDFLTTKYPDGFSSPDPAINAKFGGKGFHYNVEFLYQFKDIYKDKPSQDWDTRIKETMGDPDTRNQPRIGAPGRAVSATSGFSMGHFGKNPIIRPQPSLPSLSTGTQYTPMGSQFPPRPPRQMSNSGQGIQSPASPSGRSQSKSQRPSSRRAPPPPPPPAEPPVEPLPINPNRWKPQRTEAPLGPLPGGGDVNKLTPEVVQRKVKSLLNKLTLEKFDKITDQILEIASQSRTETDGRTLRQIIQLTFEKATDEPTFSEMYALFCRKIMETIDPNITDPAVLNKDSQPLTGGQLFRKYLLNRCQEEFERGWKVNLPPKPDDEAVGKEAELLSEEYYKAAKAKRQGLGLVQFIGELFKLNMLIEKIMYECIIRLLGGTEDPHPEPEEVESLCRLLHTVGKALDEGKAKPRMTAIYEALDHIRIHSDLESRIKFKILDVLDLRKGGWVGRATGPSGPKTIQEIHDDAAKAKAEAELARQNAPRSRQEFGRGDARLEGWNTAPRQKTDNRAGDMSKLGMVRTSSSGGLGPQTSQFNSMRSLSSRNRTAGGNTLTRDGSGQSSRTATPGMSTPTNVTSTNSFDIFRNETEAKDDELQKVVAPDDEVADGGYYTIPPIKKVASTASVPNFVVVRKGYGTISFKSPIDLTGITSLSVLREIVDIERGQVTVYPDESKHPPAGIGLNVPAEIIMENFRPPTDVELEKFVEELRSKPNTEFVSYNPELGEWKFNVQHFSVIA